MLRIDYSYTLMEYLQKLSQNLSRDTLFFVVVYLLKRILKEIHQNNGIFWCKTRHEEKKNLAKMCDNVPKLSIMWTAEVDNRGLAIARPN